MEHVQDRGRQEALEAARRLKDVHTAYQQRKESRQRQETSDEVLVPTQ